MESGIMSIIRLKRNGASWILRDGVVNNSRESIAKLGWPDRTRIRIAYIESPLLLLFEATQDENDGVLLRYSSPGNRDGSSAAIKSTPLAKIIRLHTPLPLKGLYPIYPTNGLADLALMVEEPAWVPFAFDRTGAQELPKKTGVYELLDGKETIRIGQGTLTERTREHMGNTPLANEVRSARYFLTKDREEAEAFEHLLLCRF